MNRVIPYSAYFPEPGSFFCIRRAPGSHFLNKLSFLGDGSCLENRRLIQNGREQGVLDNNAIFLAREGVVTGTPGRMRTKKNLEMKSTTYIQTKAALQALRGVSQSHASPREWAGNLYVALQFSSSMMTDVTTPMMHIFGVFDPISRMYSLTDTYDMANFQTVLTNYNQPLSQVQLSILSDARAALEKLGMPNTKIDLVVKAAKASGHAIALFLCHSCRLPLPPYPMELFN